MKICNNTKISLIIAAAAVLLFGIVPLRGATRGEETPTVTLPTDFIRSDVSTNTQLSFPVTTTEVEADDHVAGFTKSFTFDSRVVNFFTITAGNAGLTADPDWTVYVAVPSGQTGPVKYAILQIWNFADLEISGSGVLCNIICKRVSGTHGDVSPLNWVTDDGNPGYWDNNLEDYLTAFGNGSLTIVDRIISGHFGYCANSDSVTGETLNLTGSSGGVAIFDGAGNYKLGLTSGGSYTVTPSKAALAPGSNGIDGADVTAVNRHVLGIEYLTGCGLASADVNEDTYVTTADRIAINNFYLGHTTSIGNTGQYRFSPASHSYSSGSSDQTGQDYSVKVLGDVVSTFVERPVGGNNVGTINTISGPNAAAVTTSTIDAANRLVGFQGDFIFDERLISFASEPVQRAGLTAGNWDVSGRVLDGPGPIRTLRVAGTSNDFAPLSGSGPLFELRMNGVSKATHSFWNTLPDTFVFIDADLKTQKPNYAGSGSSSVKK